MLHRMAQFQRQGVTMVTLLALDDDGTPGYNHDVAASLAGLGIPAFACTPDAFPDMIALAINRGDLAGWASTEQVARAQQGLGAGDERGGGADERPRGVAQEVERAKTRHTTRGDFPTPHRQPLGCLVVMRSAIS